MNKETTPTASASRHTPGLLIRHGNLIHGGPDNREMVFKVGTHILESRELANGERLVALWNACAGMADPAAEIAALRELARVVVGLDCESKGPDDLQFVIERARLALAGIGGDK